MSVFFPERQKATAALGAAAAAGGEEEGGRGGTVNKTLNLWGNTL